MTPRSTWGDMMDQQAQQQRPKMAQKIPNEGASIKGPRQAPLSALSMSLNAAPRVQQLASMVLPTVQRAPNQSGLPDVLKAGVQSLSGMRMDHVKVHYNSAKPAQLQAHAYAQGSDIHIAPGQERHLPHEAWHVVQQAQGRVKPNVQLKLGGMLNDDAGLEREADVMGAKAMQMAQSDNTEKADSALANMPQYATLAAPLQRMTVERPAGAGGGLLALEGAAQAKLDAVIAAFTPVVANDGPGVVRVEIVNQRGMSPAETAVDGADGIVVRLNRWYIEGASVGEIVGMMAHELGVHTLADRRMQAAAPDGGRTFHGLRMAGFGAPGDRELDDEHADQTNNHNLNGHQIATYHSILDLQGDDVTPRQKDHVNLAKSLSGGFSSRAQVYQNVFLRAGDAINATQGLDVNVRDARLSDLTRTYLFDLARIVATDDGKALAIAWNSAAIAELMNLFLHRLTGQTVAHPWLNPLLNRVETRASALAFLTTKLAQLAASSHPVAQQVRTAAMGAVVAILGATVVRLVRGSI